MNNNQNCKKQQSLIDELFALSPFEFTLFGNIIAYLIAAGLTNQQQNSLGNLFELIGQVILTIQAKGSPATISPCQLQQVVDMFNGKISNIEELLSRIRNLKL